MTAQSFRASCRHEEPIAQENTFLRVIALFRARIESMRRHRSSFAVALASLAAATFHVDAATVVNPLTVSLTGADAFFPATQIIDGSGLSSLPNTGDPVPLMWTHAWGNPGSDSWVSTDP